MKQSTKSDDYALRKLRTKEIIVLYCSFFLLLALPLLPLTYCFGVNAFKITRKP